MAETHDGAKEANPAELVNTSARRRFLGKVGKAAVTTSAVALMLSAGAKRSAAGRPSGLPFNEWH
jgi:hypothetical protein